MTLKLTIQQANHLHTYLADYMIPWKPIEAEDKLLQVLMIKIYRKLRNRLEGRIKKGYSLALSDEEVIAYWIYFRYTDLSNHPYEKNFIQQHINQIDQKYA